MKRLSMIAGSTVLASVLALGFSVAADASSARSSIEAPMADVTPLAKEESVTITKHKPAVGDKEVRTKVQVISMKGTVGPKQVAVAKTDTETVEKTEECLEVKESECVKLKVTYTKDSEVNVLDGKSTSKTNPNQGKSYIVERGSPTRITALDGSTPPEAEVKSVMGGYKKPPRNKRFLAALPDQVKQGDSLDALAKELAAIAGEADDKPKAEASVVVKGFGTVGGKKVVILDVKISLDGKSDALKMQMEMKGTIEVLVDGAQPVRTTLGGPIKAELLKAGGSLSGTMKEDGTSSYQW